MKKIVLLLMSTMALSLAISCNKEDNGPIIEFKDPLVLQAFVESSHDKNGDGRISQKEADEVTEINFPNLGIRSFDELAYFPNVKRIFLNGNQLTSLDVSNNMLLEILKCSKNQLTMLDVSNNMFLKNLECDYNQLTTLDVSNNMFLENFSCLNNQLTTLNVSNNVALYKLQISDNQLTSIDLSNNTELDVFYCARNKFTVLDLSKNKLVGKSPAGVYLYDNPLKKLIISYYGMFPESLRGYYKDIIEYVYD